MTQQQAEERARKIRRQMDADKEAVAEYEEILPTIYAVQAILTDEQALEVPVLFDQWVAGEDVVAGDKRRVGDVLYRCKTSHKTQSDWAPALTPNLWERIVNGDTWVAWSSGSWAKGSKVTHKGKKWISQVDNNTWEPGAAGVYENIWKESV